VTACASRPARRRRARRPGAASAQTVPAPKGYWIGVAAGAAALALFYALLSFTRLEVFKMLLTSFFPLLILIMAVLGSIVMGLATPTEAAAVGALGGFLLAVAYRQLTFSVVKESVFLTAKTSAMVCWLFVGSAIFSAAFALLGGQELVERWVLSMNLTKTQFLVLSQVIIFVLGWPLEWTEIIVIFMPIFIPLLDNFGVDPLFFGLLVALNLQTAFLSPPVAMAAFYLQGREPAARQPEPDIPGHAAVHGHTDHRHHPAVPVPGHWPVAAAVAVQPLTRHDRPVRRIKALANYRPTHKVRFVTAASLFDGHDAAINIMRRILQGMGAEVIHLGHNRSVDEVVTAALQEDVQGIAISSYQGGHVEYFKYMVDLLRQRGGAHIQVFGGGGGVIVPPEIRELHAYGVARIFSPEDGQRMGLAGMIGEMVMRCDKDLTASRRPDVEAIQGHGEMNWRALAQLITALENASGRCQGRWCGATARQIGPACECKVPVLGITGTGGAGKSSLTDELIRRLRLDQDDACASP
jgi:methylmalonyl-CoA mutase cobalamin-binding domain/chain